MNTGIGHEGKGQSILPLKHNIKYYTNIRAITGSGSILSSTSSGFLVDTTEPIVEIISVGSDPVNMSNGDVVYQRDTEVYFASWAVTEDESDVSAVTLQSGTYPG